MKGKILVVNRRFYWEFVILYRKLIMIFISVFMKSLDLNI